MFSIIQENLSYSSEVIIIQCVWLTYIAMLVTSSSLRVIGGRDAKENEFPYVVRLEQERHSSKNTSKVWYFFFCTGSTLSPEWTLTAGHCLTNSDDNIVVSYGTPSGKIKGSKRSNVLDVFKFYDTKKYEDIGLAKTDPIELKTYGLLGALDYASLLYKEVTIAGHGFTNHTDPAEYELFPTSVLKKPLQVIKAMLIRCPATDPWSKNKKSEHVLGYMCVTQKCSEPASICSGDSGGPIIHNTRIIGVTAMAPIYNNCQMKSDMLRTPQLGWIVLVSPYVDWINSVVTIYK